MKPLLVKIGFGNFIPANRIIAVVSPVSAPIKRLKEDAKEQNKLINATYGSKTRAIIITDSNHVILSAKNPKTIALNLMGKKVGQDMENEIHDDDIEDVELENTEAKE